VALFRQVPAEITDLIVDLARQLAAHPSIVALPAVPPATVATGPSAEAAIAARHGAAHLALAVATARIVLDQAQVPAPADRSAAVVSVGIAAASALLRERPMPASYAAAVLAGAQSEYRFPQTTFGSVRTAGNRFALVEGAVPDTVDFSGNGLVTVVDGGVVIRTGTTGPVRVIVRALAEAPPQVQPSWHEVVEVSWRADHGRASVTGPNGTPHSKLRWVTPPWPGDYRLRVHARGRDEVDEPDLESYEVLVWPAPSAPEIVHRRTDRLGHRLRGEPEPARSPRPELAYRWVGRSSLAMAATVTVVTGASVDEVLRAFGADPARPQSIADVEADRRDRLSIDPWMSVLDTGDAVLAVEFNGYQGSMEPVPSRSSLHGRTASMFWNVNGVTRLSFAEAGQLLAQFEPIGDLTALPALARPEIATAIADLDFTDPIDHTGKGLVAVERFTGRAMTAEDLDQIQTTGIAYPIVPPAR
jgi:hypothetical protein